MTSQASMYESMINSLKSTDPTNTTLLSKLLSARDNELVRV